MKLWEPYISDIDTDGCILVCGHGNNRLQVCEGDSDGGGEERWSRLTLPELGLGPLDAVVGTDGHTLWVATHYPEPEIFQIQNLNITYNSLQKNKT